MMTKDDWLTEFMLYTGTYGRIVENLRRNQQLLQRLEKRNADLRDAQRRACAD